MPLREEAQRNDMAEDVNRLLNTAERRVRNLGEDIAQLIRLRDEIQQRVDNGAPNFSQADVDAIDTNIDNIVTQVQQDTEGLPVPWRGNGVEYEVGDVVIYQGTKYRVLQAHTSQADWTPDAAPSLFEAV